MSLLLVSSHTNGGEAQAAPAFFYASDTVGTWSVAIPEDAAYKSIQVVIQAAGGKGGDCIPTVSDGGYPGGGGGGAGELATITVPITSIMRGQELRGILGSVGETSGMFAFANLPQFTAAPGGNGGNGIGRALALGATGGAGGKGGDSSTKVDGVSYIKGADGGAGANVEKINNVGRIAGGSAGSATAANSPGSGGGGQSMVYDTGVAFTSVSPSTFGGGGTSGDRALPTATSIYAPGGGGSGGGINNPNTMTGTSVGSGGNYGAGGGGGAGIRRASGFGTGGAGGKAYVAVLIKTAASSVVSEPVTVAALPQAQSLALDETIEIDSMQEWYARIPVAEREDGAVYALEGTVPLGMRINSKTGYLRWTPDETQAGDHAVTLRKTVGGEATDKALNFKVANVGTHPDGIYVVSGATTKAGTFAEPCGDIQKAAKLLTPGKTLYLRGGLYHNVDWGKAFAGRTKNNLAFISQSGTEAQPITIKNFGNEYVTIQSDVNGFSLKDCNWLNIEGIEFKGTTNSIDLETARSLWWKTDETINQTGASGITINTCFHINISSCVITEWPGSGLAHNWGEYIFVEDCIIAQNARWSVGGVHGFANSKPGTGSTENLTDVKMASRRNLVIAAQQCIPSRVTSKGFADLVIDEGGGLHTQAQAKLTSDGGVVFGRWQVTDNLVMFSGKSGVNQNKTPYLEVERNSFYQNVQNTTSADIHLSPPKETDASYGRAEPKVEYNIVHSLPGARSINRIGDVKNQYVGIGINYIVEGGHSKNQDYADNTDVKEVSAVFADPASQDFRRHPSVPNNFGVSDSIIANLMQTAEEFGVELVKCPVDTSGDYLSNLKEWLIQTAWPAPDVIPADFGPAFLMHDPVVDFDYTYFTRNEWPNDPLAGGTAIAAAATHTIQNPAQDLVVVQGRSDSDADINGTEKSKEWAWSGTDATIVVTDQGSGTIIKWEIYP